MHGKETGQIFCPANAACGGKDCPKASCHMFVAWKNYKAYKDSHANAKETDPWQKWTPIELGVGEAAAITPEKGKRVYTCACK